MMPKYLILLLLVAGQGATAEKVQDAEQWRALQQRARTDVAKWKSRFEVAKKSANVAVILSYCGKTKMAEKAASVIFSGLLEGVDANDGPEFQRYLNTSVEVTRYMEGFDAALRFADESANGQVKATVCGRIDRIESQSKVRH